MSPLKQGPKSSVGLFISDLKAYFRKKNLGLRVGGGEGFKSFPTKIPYFLSLLEVELSLWPGLPVCWMVGRLDGWPVGWLVGRSVCLSLILKRTGSYTFMLLCFPSVHLSVFPECRRWGRGSPRSGSWTGSGTRRAGKSTGPLSCTCVVGRRMESLIIDR